jgi:lipopolysaccharide heptosyltransferase II
VGANGVTVVKAWVRRLYVAVWVVVIGSLAPVLRLWGGPKASDPPGRILVLRLGLLGDGVLLTPALRLLRQSFPAAEVHVLASPIQVPVVEPLPTVDHVVVWTPGDLMEPRLALQPWRWAEAVRLVRELRRQRYDVALACYGPLASALALASGAPVRAGFAGEALPGTLTVAAPGGRHDHPWHDAEYSVQVARAAGAEGPSPRTELVVDPVASASMDRVRPAANVNGTGSQPPLVVLHPGATNGKAKRWPVAYWVKLTTALWRDGCVVALVGRGAEDLAIAGHVERAVLGAGSHPQYQIRNTPFRESSGCLLNLVGQTSTAELIALLDRANVVVSGDSGPVHIAVALGRPVIAIYGPSDPAVWGPFQADHATVLWHKLPCAPCYRLGRIAECPLGHTLCQHLIEPRTVYRAVRRAMMPQPAASTDAT